MEWSRRKEGDQSKTSERDKVSLIFWKHTGDKKLKNFIMYLWFAGGNEMTIIKLYK